MCQHRDWALPISSWHQENIAKYLAPQKSKHNRRQDKIGFALPKPARMVYL